MPGCVQRKTLTHGTSGSAHFMTHLASCRNLALRSGGSVSRQDFTATGVLSARRRPLNTSPKFPCNSSGFLPQLPGIAALSHLKRTSHLVPSVLTDLSPWLSMKSPPHGDTNVICATFSEK